MNDRFLELLTKELAGEISAVEQDELKTFLTDELYKTHYITFKLYWENKDAEYADDALLFKKIKSRIHSLENPDEAPEAAQPPARSAFFTFWRSAAAVLMISGCAGLFYYLIDHPSTSLNNSHAVALQEKTTKRAAKAIITLSDGTRITLNSESKLRYPAEFTGNTREVYLSGEAFFDVAKDHQHPFIIHTGKMNVRVLGTAFNVKSYPNESVMETTLIRGSIQVTLADRPLDHIILKPKEKLIVRNGQYAEKSTLTLKTPDPEKESSPKFTLTTLTYFAKHDTNVVETSWVQNKLMVKDTEFADLAEKMQRWYGYDIHFANDEVKHLHFTATFEKEDILQALKALSLVEKFHYKLNKSVITIY